MNVVLIDGYVRDKSMNGRGAFGGGETSGGCTDVSAAFGAADDSTSAAASNVSFVTGVWVRLCLLLKL